LKKIVVYIWARRSTSYSFVQALLLPDISFSHNAHRHRQTDGRTDGQTDSIMPIADHTARSTIGEKFILESARSKSSSGTK